MSDTVLSLDITQDTVPAFISRLRPARYTSPGGVESAFLYDSLSRTRPKKGAAHEVPDSDDTILQDMGSGLRSFSMAVYFVGENCDQLADAFYDSLYERYTADKPGILAHPRWGNINVMPFGEPEQSEEYVSGAGISRVSVVFRETKSLANSKTAKLTTSQISKSVDSLSATALVPVATGIPTDKAGFAKFVAQTKKKVRAITTTLNTVRDTLGDSAAEIDAIVNDVYAAMAENASPQAIMSQIGGIVTAMASVASTGSDMVTAFVEMFGDISTDYSADIANASTTSDRMAVATSLQYVGPMVAACASLAALNSTYQTRDEVGGAVDGAMAIYDEYATLLDTASVAPSQNIASNFIADHNTASSLQGVVLDTQALLIDKAFALRSRRTYVLSAPTDPLTATWNYYGDLGELSFFCKTNKVKASEFVELPAGREVVVYV